MSERLLRQYLRLAVRESQARVPNQLLPADGGDEESDSGSDTPEEGFNEFCGVGGGAVMGYAEPLGGQRKSQQKQ